MLTHTYILSLSPTLTHTHAYTRFKAMVECERITLWSFTGHYQVSSFKYAGPSQTFLDCIDRQMTSKDTSRYGGFTATPNEITEALDPTRTSISGEEQAKGREGETEELVMDADMEVTKEAIRRMRRLQRLKEVKREEGDHISGGVKGWERRRGGE